MISPIDNLTLFNILKPAGTKDMIKFLLLMGHRGKVVGGKWSVGEVDRR